MFPVTLSGTVASGASSAGRADWAVGAVRPSMKYASGATPVLVTFTSTTAGWFTLILPAMGRPTVLTVAAFWSSATLNGSLSAVRETVGANVMISVQRPAAGLRTWRFVPRLLV